MTQDHLQQTLVISQRRSQETLTEQAASKGNAAKAREWQSQGGYTETGYSDAIKDTHEKTEALEQHVKTVTMRAESWATTEANFFRTILDRQEETQKHLNELSSLPSYARPAPHRKKRAAKKRQAHWPV